MTVARVAVAAGLAVVLTQVFTVNASPAVFLSGLLIAFVGLLRLGDVATNQEEDADVRYRD